MADVPDQLTLRRNRDAEGRRDLFICRGFTGVLAIIALLGLLNVFETSGQLSFIPKKG